MAINIAALLNPLPSVIKFLDPWGASSFMCQFGLANGFSPWSDLACQVWPGTWAQTQYANSDLLHYLQSHIMGRNLLSKFRTTHWPWGHMLVRHRSSPRAVYQVGPTHDWYGYIRHWPTVSGPAFIPKPPNSSQARRPPTLVCGSHPQAPNPEAQPSNPQDPRPQIPTHTPKVRSFFPSWALLKMGCVLNSGLYCMG